MSIRGARLLHHNIPETETEVERHEEGLGNQTYYEK